MIRRTGIGLLFLSLVAFSALGQSLSPFSDGDRVAFLGNSITDGGRYHSFIWLYYMTRFPDRAVTIYNGGIGGDRVVEMEKRLDADVLARKPTKLFLIFGMNDSGYSEYLTEDPGVFGEKIVAESDRNYQQMERRLQALPDVEVSLLGSTPYDETSVRETEPFVGKHSAMQKIVDYQRQSARDNGWGFFDFNEPMTDLNRKFQRIDPAFSLSGFDRIHPDNDGHMVMAYLFLKAQGLANQPVAQVEIDARKARASAQQNCSISNITRDAHQLTFAYLANSLPYPIDTIPLNGEYNARQSDALRIVPFMKEMNNEALKVKGLDEGIYEVLIDSVRIGSWTRKELEEGINLAEIPWTPQYQQALAIMHLNERRWRIERELRDYTWIQYYFFEKRGLLYADDKVAMEALNAAIPHDKWLTGRRNQYALLMHREVREAYQDQVDILISKIYEINKPKTHLICVRRSGN
ncbi:hypothetical protein GCM10011386_22690 [Parapedobacter defluvii]|uniref:SGNH hydrolase-type esterase domain-containing protein n=1 Tax=Parapedobacter defluvii TaxID=2045106 RepID=A0ABQ1LXD7_9SPHI|nr:SGNH/GDSL hydrolase family protein [Parapedobacter defluvii]GGC30149.1 hypothetical protein GCM10011386_22690 [Parapedobacter defluvii]